MSEFPEISTIDARAIVVTDKDTVRVPIGLTLNRRIIRDFLILIYDRHIGGTITCSNMPGFVCNNKSYSTWLIMLVAKQYDWPTFDNPCEALKAWCWQYIERDNWNASPPKILGNVM